MKKKTKPYTHCVGSDEYQLSETNQDMNRAIMRRVAEMKYPHGVNPCVSGDTIVLTDEGPVSVLELVGIQFSFYYQGEKHTSTEDGFFSKGVKPVLQVFTQNGRTIKTTSDHKMMLADGSWKTTGELKSGDTLATFSGTHGDVVIAVKQRGEEEVFDCSVPGLNWFPANGLIAHNCGEISLNNNQGFCVVGDFVPYYATKKITEEDAARLTTRALMRVNLMPSVYSAEVRRTNRIGVSFTGIHEYALSKFGYGFRDLLDEYKTLDFWLKIASMSRAVKEEARRYAAELGLPTPHTDTTNKPSGSTSKLFNLTEGIHLPSMLRYLRWVQFPVNSPMVETYRQSGYPVRELKSLPNTVIVGFPTKTELCILAEKIDAMDKVVTADQATMDEQFQWLQLIEKYWIIGTDEDGKPLPDTGNQISATIKFNMDSYTLESFRQSILEWLPQIKCVSVMPQTDLSAYEYVPEQSITKEEYDQLLAQIHTAEQEDVGLEHITCEGGACPVDFKA